MNTKYNNLVQDQRKNQKRFLLLVIITRGMLCLVKILFCICFNATLPCQEKSVSLGFRGLCETYLKKKKRVKNNHTYEANWIFSALNQNHGQRQAQPLVPQHDYISNGRAKNTEEYKAASIMVVQVHIDEVYRPRNSRVKTNTHTQNETRMIHIGLEVGVLWTESVRETGKARELR